MRSWRRGSGRRGSGRRGGELGVEAGGEEGEGVDGRYANATLDVTLLYGILSERWGRKSRSERSADPFGGGFCVSSCLINPLSPSFLLSIDASIPSIWRPRPPRLRLNNQESVLYVGKRLKSLARSVRERELIGCSSVQRSIRNS